MSLATGQHPKRRESDAQAARRIEKLERAKRELEHRLNLFEQMLERLRQGQ